MDGRESRYRAWLNARGGSGLLRVLQSAEHDAPGRVGYGGSSYVNFSGNDYLGLARHPALIERAREWAERYGAGAGASRLVTGNLDLFEGIEARVAKLKDKPAAIVMASGFQANASVLQALFDQRVLEAEPLVFADRLNHASMHFGCRAAGVRQHRYRHRDVEHLADLLAKYGGGPAPKFILTESVFSMDGDVAPMEDIAALAHQYQAILVCDDAHATGILGAGGKGLSGAADIVIGTFSKAMGSYGAYIACSRTMREYLVNRCSGLIYSTALPPPVLGAIDASLELVPGLDAERAHASALADKFREGAKSLGYDTGASATQIVPLIVGGADDALALSAQLKDAGYWAGAIRPPTVPRGTARLRLAFCATHTGAQIDALLEKLSGSRGNKRASRA